MTFSLTRPPSREGPISSQGHEGDHLSSALHAALSSIVPSSAHQSHHHDMIKEKEKAGIDIVVDSDCLSLKGTGVDVEPALLKGHIVLHLTEPTSIKEITVVFRGKAKLPAPTADALTLTSSPQWYTICNHEWSFLEGEKRHSHTLKAGYHHFPFQMQLGGSLPSSITSSANGGAHISYKLRAVAVRPGLSHNMQAVMPISILRTFAPEALEYQQSLEIENTWPEKLMYSIMLPHKAWAAGDKLSAIAKFSPISKGVRVLAIQTTINETTKIHCRGGMQEHTRAVVTANHKIRNGHGMPILEHQGAVCETSTAGLSNADRSGSTGSLGALATQDLTLREVSSRASSSSSSHESYSALPPPQRVGELMMSTGEPTASTSTLIREQDVPISQDDVVTQLTLFIPKSVTPSHAVEPITVSHRIRWSILMSNLDGHTSELRCSLPLHILDSRLLDEAKVNSAATRRLLLECSEVPTDKEQEAELPSYSAHIRDRVANMYLPDSATTRVLNPWVHNSVSPTFASEHQSGASSRSGATSPLIPHSASPHLPHVPPAGTSAPLDWVNSELLLSLSNSAPHQPHANTSPYSHSPYHTSSRPESRHASRRGSRAESPERHLTITSHPAPVSTVHDTFVHDGHASRTLPGLFSIQMKPYTSLTSTGWLSSRPNSQSNLTSLMEAHGLGHRATAQGNHVQRSLSTVSMTPVTTSGSRPAPLSISVSTAALAPGQGSSMSSPVTPESENALWHRAFTEVPDYGVASRGFIGGVTPLTSMSGLPSYEEAKRSANGGDDGRLTIGRRASRQD